MAAGLAVASPACPGTRFERAYASVPGGLTLRGEWVHPASPADGDGVVLYFHGSGFAVCSSRTHRGLTSHIANRAGAPIFSVDYRLAPTFRYPAAHQDVRAAWEWMLAQGHPPGRVVVAGDSAGGHLAVGLALQLAREGLPLPAAVVALSPVLDLRLVDALVRDRIERDPFASARAARRVLSAYADDKASRHAGLHLHFDGVGHFPPTLIHAGSREMLAADSTELARRIRGAGFQVEHRVWPGQMHVFQALTSLMPESQVALDDIGRFIRAGHAAVPAREAIA